MNTKVCKVCKIEKDWSQFYKNKQHEFGIDNRCISCEKTRHKEQKERRQYVLENNILYEGVPCKICNVTTTMTHDKHYSAVIDHCHDTKKFRGILCKSCNSALGKFGDDIPMLKKAIEYLKSFKDRKDQP